jgi:hypothetical protein
VIALSARQRILHTRMFSVAVPLKQRRHAPDLLGKTLAVAIDGDLRDATSVGSGPTDQLYDF